jgi:thiamine biosynthesis lipoprotein
MTSPKPDLVTSERTFLGLGTFISLETTLPRGAPSPHEALAAAFEPFEIVEAAMHPVRAGSDLVAIRNSSEGESVPVHEWTFEVLRLSQNLWVASGGVFDPCLPREPGGLCDLDLSEPMRVRRRGPAVALDLGGIAKGFAVDRAIETLQRLGCVDGLVNAGGDLRVFGAEPRAIELRRAGTVAGHVSLHEEALAVSEPRTPASPCEHRGFYSRTAGQVLAGRWVAIRASTAAMADALTKCAIGCPPNVLDNLLRAYGARQVDAEAP